MLASARSSAKKRGLKFTITTDDVVIPTHCPIFGFPLKRSARGARAASPSLDRIDNSKGYEPGNIVVVSYRANRLKSDATIDELEQIVAFYKALDTQPNLS